MDVLVKSVIVRAPGLVWREVDGEVFLASDKRGVIQSLDSTSSAVWRFLEKPQTRRSCVEIFGTAFPEHKPRKVAKTVNKAIDKMKAAGIVILLSESDRASSTG